MNNEKELININAHVCRYWHKSVSLVGGKISALFWNTGISKLIYWKQKAIHISIDGKKFIERNPP
jgi:hypothetical protein